MSKFSPRLYGEPDDEDVTNEKQNGTKPAPTRIDVVNQKYSRFEIHNPKGYVMKYIISRTDPNDQYPHVRFFLASLDGGFSYVGVVDPESGTVDLTPGSRFAEGHRVVDCGRYAVAVIWGNRTLPAGYSVHGSKASGRRDQCLIPPTREVPEEPPF